MSLRMKIIQSNTDSSILMCVCVWGGGKGVFEYAMFEC